MVFTHSHLQLQGDDIYCAEFAGRMKVGDGSKEHWNTDRLGLSPSSSF